MKPQNLTTLPPSTFTSPRPASPAGKSDSLLSSPRLLSRAGLRWLAEIGHLMPAPGSPLATVHSPSTLPGAKRGAGSGAFLDSAVGGEAGERLGGLLRESPFGRALAIAERPEARLRLALTEPGRAPLIQELFVRGGEAVAAWEEPSGFRLGEPVGLAVLGESLLQRLGSAALDEEMVALCILPEIFELVSALWPERGKRLSRPLDAGELTTLLVERGSGRRDARRRAAGLLASMSAAGLLVERDGRFFLRGSFRRWLVLVWSGHAFELERTELGADARPCSPPDRLLFAGPPAQRVLCEDLAGAEGDSIVLLTRPTRHELRQRLVALLRPTPTLAAHWQMAGEPLVN